MESLAGCVSPYIRISCIVCSWLARPRGLPLGLPIWLLHPPSLSPNLSLFLTSYILYIIRVGKGKGICRVKVGGRLRRRFKEAVEEAVREVV